MNQWCRNQATPITASHDFRGLSRTARGGLATHCRTPRSPHGDQVAQENRLVDARATMLGGGKSQDQMHVVGFG